MQNNMEPMSKLSERKEKIMVLPQSLEEKADKQLEQLKKHPQSKEAFYKLISTINKMTSMKVMRAAWDKLPKFAQWLTMKTTRVPGLWLTLGPVEYLVKAGLLEYKGYDDKKGEDEVAQLGGMEKALLKYGIEAGSLFFPELKPLMPIIKPVMQIEGLKEEYLTYVRQRLRTEKLESKKVKREIRNIARDVRDQTRKNYLS